MHLHLSIAYGCWSYTLNFVFDCGYESWPYAIVFGFGLIFLVNLHLCLTMVCYFQSSALVLAMIHEFWPCTLVCGSGLSFLGICTCVCLYAMVPGHMHVYADMVY